MAVDLAAVKRHLQIPATDTDPDGDADLTLKLAQAEAIILDYIKATANPPTGAAATIVDAAVLLQVGELWRFRGDDRAGAKDVHCKLRRRPSRESLSRRVHAAFSGRG